MRRYASNIKHIERTVIILTLVLCVLLSGCIQSTPAYAGEDRTFDTVNVLDDLRSSTANGKAFDLREYPYNEKGSVKIINFVEYCYSFKSNMQGNYGLYIYVYNPQNLTFDTSVKQNKIQMAVSYTAAGKPTHYEKFNLIFCNKSEENGYKNLFYKFRVEDREISGKTFIDRVNSNERRYDISGIELATKGNRNATEYGVGGSYKFTGYVAGYGPDSSDESNLSCVVENLETLELSVRHTYYRTNVSSLGKDHYNEVNTVYFSLPERFFNEYGNLQKIRAEWWEYKTKYAAVTSDRNFYNSLLQYVERDVGDYDNSVPVKLGYGYSGQASAGLGSPTIHNFDWTYNIDISDKKTIFGTYSEIYFVKKIQSIMPYAFYSPTVDVDSVFDFLYSKPVAGDVDSTVVSDWIYNYSNDLGHGYVDCNGRKISKDLFENYVDEGRTMGHNDKTIDLSDTFDLKSYDSNHNWWDKLWDYGFSWPKTSGDYSNVAPIYILGQNDLIGSTNDISDRLLINKKDVAALQSYYAAETLKGNRVVLFRFATTDYFCGIASPNGSTLNPNTYVASETVFLDFDIIELTFHKNGVYHVIPVVSSPTDIINGFTAPPTEFQWWKILVALLFLILFIVLLAPVMPYIIRAVIWIVTLPFKAIKAISQKVKEHKSNRDKKESRKAKE